MVVLLPMASVVSACIFVRPDGWRLLWIRSVGFYGMALLPVGLAVLASLVWRMKYSYNTVSICHKHLIII